MEYGLVPEDIINLLKLDRDSEEITMFRLQYPDVEVKSKDFVINNWNLFRKHIPVSSIAIINGFMGTKLSMPAWLGSTDFEFEFWSPRESDIVVDCIDMHMRYEAMKEMLT